MSFLLPDFTDNSKEYVRIREGAKWKSDAGTKPHVGTEQKLLAEKVEQSEQLHAKVDDVAQSDSKSSDRINKLKALAKERERDSAGQQLASLDEGVLVMSSSDGTIKEIDDPLHEQPGPSGQSEKAAWAKYLDSIRGQLICDCTYPCCLFIKKTWSLQHISLSE